MVTHYIDSLKFLIVFHIKQSEVPFHLPSSPVGQNDNFSNSVDSVVYQPSHLDKHYLPF